MVCYGVTLTFVMHCTGNKTLIFVFSRVFKYCIGNLCRRETTGESPSYISCYITNDINMTTWFEFKAFQNTRLGIQKQRRCNKFQVIFSSLYSPDTHLWELLLLHAAPSGRGMWYSVAMGGVACRAVCTWLLPSVTYRLLSVVKAAISGFVMRLSTEIILVSDVSTSKGKIIIVHVIMQ
jgi:hypothetical protein